MNCARQVIGCNGSREMMPATMKTANYDKP